MLSIGAESKKRASEGVGVNRPKKRAKPKRRIGTKFISFTCELDKDNCIHDENGLCIAHNTPAGNSKVKCLVNDEVAQQLSCGCHKKVEFECDVCLHVFSISLGKVSDGQWCSMCSSHWKHCGVVTCTFCFDRSFASYKGLTLNGKKKVDCIVNQADLIFPRSSGTKKDFKCDVCLHVFSISLDNITCDGKWCGMCSSNWKHCGVMTCTYCFGRSFASYEGLTLNGKKKVDCIVNQSDLILPMSCRKKVDFECDVCFHPFSILLNSVTSTRNWCGTCKNKTELKVLNYLQEMNIKVITQYIPGGMKQMKKNYGKFCKMDYYLPNSNIIWELDGRQHNTQVIRFGNTTLFQRMILDKWKEFWARKCGMNVIRFDQVAIWGDKYDWKQEMRNLLTLASDKLRRQLEETKKRYKKYTKEHNNKSKRRIVPEIVKRSHAMFTIMSFISKYK